MALSFLAPILGAVGKAALRKTDNKFVDAALDTVEDFFEPTGREQAKELEVELEQVKQSGKLARIQAKDKNLFIRAARPALLWVSVFAAAYHFVLFPILNGLAAKYNYPLVDLDWQELSILLGLALGMTGARTYEKMKGISRESLKEHHRG